MQSTETPAFSGSFFVKTRQLDFLANCFSLLRDPQTGSMHVYNKGVLTKFTHEKDWTSNASGNRHTHWLEEIQHLCECWFWRVHIREITRQSHCWDWSKRWHRFEFMRLGHTNDQIKIERNLGRVHFRLPHLPERFHLVRWRSEHPIFWRFQDRKMSKLIKTFCNNALLPWAFFLISKHVLRRVKRHDLGGVRSRGAGILWTAPRGGLRTRSTYQRYCNSRTWLSWIGQFTNWTFLQQYVTKPLFRGFLFGILLE